MIDAGALRMPVREDDAVPSAAPASHILRIESLSAYFGDTQAVRAVSLTVLAHEVTAIIGPSGCGKSTLLRCLNRMHESVPTARVSGHVFFHDQDIYGE